MSDPWGGHTPEQKAFVIGVFVGMFIALVLAGVIAWLVP